MKKYRILCIDDSKSVHAFLKICLEPITQSIESVYNGVEAIKRLTGHFEDFDIIFLDWEMPVKDGPTTFKELHKMGLKIPVFMLTSKNDPLDIMEMINAGVTEYILKPFTQDIILEKVKDFVG